MATKGRGRRAPGALDAKQLAMLGTGVTCEQYKEQFIQREAAYLAKEKLMLDPARSGQERYEAQSRYVYAHGQNVYWCRRCWLLPGVCICPKLASFDPSTRVIVHVHAFEWGQGTNSGSVLAASLSSSRLLLKGLPEHDAELQQLLDDPSHTVAVLWPGEGAVLPDELQRIADERSAGRIAVIAVDASWGNARKMRGSYPPGLLQVKLPAWSVLPSSNRSLLFAIRKYKGGFRSLSRACCWLAADQPAGWRFA
jgi:DTW domain-containing protein YfiP